MLIRASLAGLCCLGLGWLIVAETFAQEEMRRGRPAFAILWRPSSPSAAASLAESYLSRGATGAARQQARAALNITPWNAIALRILGLTEERVGDARKAASLMALGAKLGWRDTQTQIWLLKHTLADANFHVAMQHGDALARRQKALPLVFALMTAATTSPQGIDALVERLEVPSNWREKYFSQLGNVPRGFYPSLSTLFERMKTGATPPSRKEAAPLMLAMILHGKGAEARALWTTLFGNSGPSTYVTEGGFDRTDPSSPEYTTPTAFDWWLNPSAKGYADIMEAPTSQGNSALRIISTSADTSLFGRQVVILPPGTYELTARIYANREDASRVISSDITCQDGQTKITPPPSPGPLPTGRWVRFKTLFTVPREGCAYQSLNVRSLPRESHTEASLWFDDFVISPAN
jgi:hypothetical protein